MDFPIFPQRFFSRSLADWKAPASLPAMPTTALQGFGQLSGLEERGEILAAPGNISVVLVKIFIRCLHEIRIDKVYIYIHDKHGINI